MSNREPTILIIRRDNIGDLVCTTPLVRALRRQLPDARIEFLATRYNEAVLHGNPDIDGLHSYTKAKHRAPGESLLNIYSRRLTTILALRRSRFDWVLLPGGRHASSMSFVRWIGGQHIVVRNEGDCVAGPHEVEQACHMLERIGLDYETPSPHVVADPNVAGQIRSRLDKRWAIWPRRLVALHISARKPSQRWPAERFVALARKLHAENPDWAFLLLWAPGQQDDPHHPGDDEKAQAVLSATGNLPIQPVPTVKLVELIAALSLCDLMICGDGGAMHLAAGLGKPIICLFGHSDAERWHPWGVPYRLLQTQERSVMNIAVDDVLSALEDFKPILNRETPKHAA